MKRGIRTYFVIFSSVFCLSIIYTLFFLTRKPGVLGLTMLSKELNRQLTEENVSLVLNAEEQRQHGVTTKTERACDHETKLRKSFDPVELRAIQDDPHHLMLIDLFLTTVSWHLNPQNLAAFREKLKNQTNSTFQEDFILTQHNAKVGDSLPYSYTNSFSTGKKFFYNVSEKFYAADVSKNSPLSGKRFKRCSVVGNSGILSNSTCGKEIDQSDYVIRSNLPPIRPHVADAGWKTNLTTMNPSMASRRFGGLKTEEAIISFVKTIGDYDGVLWLPCVASTAMIGLCLKVKHTLDNHGVQNPKASLANPYLFLAVTDFWKERNLKKVMSTGFYLTHLALMMCEETHLYGFWPFPYRLPDRVTDSGTNTMRKVKYHYFDKVGLTKAHAINDEFSLLLQMHFHGLLHLHVRDCDG